MARKKAGKEIATWDEELAKYAEAAAAAEANAGGGQFFGLKGGILTWQDSPMPDNEIPVIILDSIFENVFFEGDYDPDNPSGPTCFAFARKEDDLAPHEIVVKAEQHQSVGSCEDCEHNEWGSAERGRGKACRNTRRLSMIPAGSFDRNGDLEFIDEPSHYENTTMGFMKLPVTSVNGYASFVKQIAGALRRPPFGIITRLRVIPDNKTQFRVLFEPIDNVPVELKDVIMTRVEEARRTIDFPYQLNDDDYEAPAQKSKSGGKKAVTKKKTTRRGKKY